MYIVTCDYVDYSKGHLLPTFIASVETANNKEKTCVDKKKK